MLERFLTVRAVRVNKAMVNSQLSVAGHVHGCRHFGVTKPVCSRLFLSKRDGHSIHLTGPQSLHRLLWGRDVRRGGAMAYPSECISTRTSKAISSTMAYSRNVEC